MSGPVSWHTWQHAHHGGGSGGGRGPCEPIDGTLMPCRSTRSEEISNPALGAALCLLRLRPHGERWLQPGHTTRWAAAPARQTRVIALGDRHACITSRCLAWAPRWQARSMDLCVVALCTLLAAAVRSRRTDVRCRRAVWQWSRGGVVRRPQRRGSCAEPQWLVRCTTL